MSCHNQEYENRTKLELQPFIVLRLIRHLLYPQWNGPLCLWKEAELTGDPVWAQGLTEQSVHCQNRISGDQLQQVILSVWYSGFEYIFPYSHLEYRFAPGAASGFANSSICSRLFEPRTGFMQCPSTVTTRITCNQRTASSDMESSVNSFFLYWRETDLPGRSIHLQFGPSMYCIRQCRSSSCLILHQPFTNNCYSVTLGLDFITCITYLSQNGVLPILSNLR